MSITQNEKIRQVTEETMVVGVDIASETHYARVFDNRGIEFGRVFSFGSNREGFEQFSARVSKLMADTGKTTVIVGADCLRLKAANMICGRWKYGIRRCGTWTAC